MCTSWIAFFPRESIQMAFVCYIIRKWRKTRVSFNTGMFDCSLHWYYRERTKKTPVLITITYMWCHFQPFSHLQFPKECCNTSTEPCVWADLTVKVLELNLVLVKPLLYLLDCVWGICHLLAYWGNNASWSAPGPVKIASYFLAVTLLTSDLMPGVWWLQTYYV